MIKKETILWIFIIVICLMIFFCGYLYSEYSRTDDHKLTEGFQILSKTVIYQVGKTRIDTIVNISSSYENDTDRLNKIADLITENFSNGLWDNTPFQRINGKSLYYQYNQNGQIFIVGVDDSNRDLAIDPYWLIFQKVGACRELSILFNDITNKSGFVTRIVRTGDGDSNGVGATHWWNEVSIDDQNFTFDVQLYGQIKYGKKNGTSWYGNRSQYTKGNSDGFTPSQLCEKGGVWLTGANGQLIEEVTDDYITPNKCTVGLEKNRSLHQYFSSILSFAVIPTPSQPSSITTTTLPYHVQCPGIVR